MRFWKAKLIGYRFPDIDYIKGNNYVIRSEIYTFALFTVELTNIAIFIRLRKARGTQAIGKNH